VFLMGILFMAEISRRENYSPKIGTPSTRWSRAYNIYELYIGSHPENTYWIAWGGWYDNPVTQKAELYIGQYLINAMTLANMLAQENSFCIDGDTIYFNIPKHPWLYADHQAFFRATFGWLSGPPIPENPSNIEIADEARTARLDIPSISVKLSDPISGLTKYTTFDFSIANDDGEYDGANIEQYFNSPAYIWKTRAEKPSLADFTLVRYGIIEDIQPDDKSVTFSCADQFRALEESVCEIITAEEYPVTKDDALGKELPVVYGRVELNLIVIGEEDTESRCLVAEKISAVHGVYDSDGQALNYSFNASAGIITVPAQAIDDKELKPKYADITGYTNKRIGQIIIDLIETRAGIIYNSTNWDVTETNVYRNSSPQVNYAITSGDVKKAIGDILKSDMAYLIQKNDGRLTLRQWGSVYQTHTIASWLITQQPRQSYSDAQKQYMSSCVINYQWNERTKIAARSLYADEREAEAEAAYTKLRRVSYDTRLINETDARALATRLQNRFLYLKETAQLGIGDDTSTWNLLDKVICDLTINGRTYSEHPAWIVKEIDAAQDKLTMEAL
jgi:uncharacterized Fe-S cluster protein YjdI